MPGVNRAGRRFDSSAVLGVLNTHQLWISAQAIEEKQRVPMFMIEAFHRE